MLQPCDDSRDAHAVRRGGDAVLRAAVVPVRHVVVFALAGIAAEGVGVLLQGAVPRLVHGLLNGGAVVHVQRDAGFARGDDVEPAESRRDVRGGARGRLEEVRDETAAVVAHVEGETRANLFQVVRAADALRFLAGLRQRWQQHGRQNRDDRDDDQKFNECESSLFFHVDLVLSYPCH